MKPTSRIASIIATLLALASALPAHGQRATRQCQMNSDCMEPLTCSSEGLCQVQCRTDRDCSGGQLCLAARWDNQASAPANTDGVVTAIPSTPGSTYNRCLTQGYENFVAWENGRVVVRPPRQHVVVTAVPAASGYAQPTGTVAPARPAEPPRSDTPLNVSAIAAATLIPRGSPSFEKTGPNAYALVTSNGPLALGGELMDMPVGASLGDGSILVVGRGMDKAIWMNTCGNGRCAGWSSLGGVLVSAPTARRESNGSITVTATGTDGRPWFTTVTNGAGSGWAPAQ